MQFYQQILGAISIILSLISSQVGVNNSVIPPVVSVKQVVVKPVTPVAPPIIQEVVRKNIMGWFDVGESFKCCEEEKSCVCQLREYRRYESNKSEKYVVTNKKMFKDNCQKCICDKACVVDLGSTKTFYNEIVREYFSTQEGDCHKDCDMMSDISCGDLHLNCSTNNYWQKNNMLKDSRALEQYIDHDWYEYAEFFCFQGGCRKRIAKYKFCLEDKCVESVSLPIIY
jgi:hypothetical protein